MPPEVSILMPVYRTAPWLHEAMDSMLTQTFTDFELIVLDDCSPDNAAEILDTYSDPRIVRYKGEHNSGLANVLNVGIDMARGKYIVRMDSDDISLPTRLEVQVRYMESHPDIDLCSTAMQLFGERNGIWRRSLEPEKVKVDALFFSPILHASSLWRRESFERHNLCFRQEMVPAEDYDLWTRALLCGLRLVNLPDVLYHYRIREGQATTAPSQREAEVRQAYIRATLPTLTNHQADNIARNILPCLAANRRSHFFDSRMLLKRLIKIRCQKSR